MAVCTEAGEPRPQVQLPTWLLATNPSSRGLGTHLPHVPGDPGRAQLATTSPGCLWAPRGRWASSRLPHCACTLPLRPRWLPPVPSPASRRPWTAPYTSSRLQCPWPALVSLGLGRPGGLPFEGHASPHVASPWSQSSSMTS